MVIQFWTHFFLLSSPHLRYIILYFISTFCDILCDYSLKTEVEVLLSGSLSWLGISPWLFRLKFFFRLFILIGVYYLTPVLEGFSPSSLFEWNSPPHSWSGIFFLALCENFSYSLSDADFPLGTSKLIETLFMNLCSLYVLATLPTHFLFV